MKERLWNSVTWRWIFSAALILTACKQAGYEVLKPRNQSPNSFDSSKTLAPTARLEVLDRGTSVTWTYVGNRIEVKPTADTLDPDYVGKESCQNPGLISADYDLGNGTKPSVQRTECSSLASAGHVFTKSGTYLVKMTVKSKDNEIATASMTLRVIDRNVAASMAEGGFTIHAKPILAEINQPVVFSGICELKGKLSIGWNYGDSATGAGAVTQHTYGQAGQYLVTATCANDTGKKYDASLTVVIMGATAPSIPAVAVPIPGQNPNLPRTNGCDPSQGPCQNAGQIPNGATTVPSSSGTVWYYDPFCRCYISY
jgi:PKD repeat protein